MKNFKSDKEKNSKPESVAFLERKRYCHMMGIWPHCGEDLGCSLCSVIRLMHLETSPSLSDESGYLKLVSGS